LGFPESRVTPHLCFPRKPVSFSEHIQGYLVSSLCIVADDGPDALVFEPLLWDPSDVLLEGEGEDVVEWVHSYYGMGLGQYFHHKMRDGVGQGIRLVGFWHAVNKN